MSTPGEKRIARCAGHSYGRESSLRAEVTGMLPASVFVAMVKQYKSNQEKVMKVKYVSDNMELVKRGREHKTYKEYYANTILRVEYDLIEQIYMTN